MPKDKKYEKRMLALKPASSSKKPEIKKVESKKVTTIQKPYKRKVLAGGEKKGVGRKGLYSEKTGKSYSSVRQRSNAEKKQKANVEVGDFNPRSKKKQTY